MSICGIVAEYNPFHEGHAYQISEIKRQGAKEVIVVMSSSFVQRGEVAILPPRVRAKAALLGGADLVLAMPVLFSCAVAPSFAFGGIASLLATGLVDEISCGSESGNLSSVMALARLLFQESAPLKQALHAAQHHCFSFAQAREQAVYTLAPTLAPLLRQPNDLLAVEYAKVLLRLAPHVPLHLIQRQGQGHNDCFHTGGFASATTLREALKQKDQPFLENHIPPAALSVYRDALQKGQGPCATESLFSALQYALRRSSAMDLSDILEVDHGLEHRIISLFATASSWADILARLQTKHMPRSSLSRALVHILLGITSLHLQQVQHTKTVPYLRVLGVRREKRNLLSRLAASSTVPVITQVKPALSRLPSLALQTLYLDLLASDLQAMLYPNPAQRQCGQSLTEPLLVV